MFKKILSWLRGEPQEELTLISETIELWKKLELKDAGVFQSMRIIHPIFTNAVDYLTVLKAATHCLEHERRFHLKPVTPVSLPVRLFFLDADGNFPSSLLDLQESFRNEAILLLDLYDRRNQNEQIISHPLFHAVLPVINNLITLVRELGD